MGRATKIEWTDSTANPLVGCDGCELHRAGEAESHCYAAGLVGRYAGLPGWPASFDKPEFFPARIKRALAWPDLTGKERPDKPWLNGKPRHIFWCDLSDPFTESMPVDWLAPYLPMLADSPHVHIFCTKRPHRARQLFEEHPAPKNLILLTTVTSAANIGRVSELLHVPGISVRGLSLEPLLGRVDLGLDQYVSGEGCERRHMLDWVIAGGETGAGARPSHPDWFRQVRDECQRSGVAYFHKQNGQYIPICSYYEKDDDVRERALDRKHILVTHSGYEWQVGAQGTNEAHDGQPPADTWIMHPVGKRAAGRLLDGRVWDEMPEVRCG